MGFNSGFKGLMVSNFALTNARNMEHIKMSDIRLAVRNSHNHLKQTGYHSYTLHLIRYELDSLIPWIEILVEKLTALQVAK